MTTRPIGMSGNTGGYAAQPVGGATAGAATNQAESSPPRRLGLDLERPTVPVPSHPHALQDAYSSKRASATWLDQIRKTFSSVLGFGKAADNPVRINWQQACERHENLDQHEKQFAEKGEEYQKASGHVKFYDERNALNFSPAMRELMTLFNLATHSIHCAIPFGRGNVLVRKNSASQAEGGAIEQPVDIDATQAKDGLESLAQEIRKAMPRNKETAKDAAPGSRVSAKAAACSILTGSGTCVNYGHLAALMVADILFQHRDKFSEPAKIELRHDLEIGGKKINHLILVASFAEAETGKKHEILFDPWAKMSMPVRLEDSRYEKGREFYSLSCDKPVEYKKWIKQYMDDARELVGKTIESDDFDSARDKAANVIPEADPATTYELTDAFHGYVDHDGINTLKEGVVVPPQNNRQSLLAATSSPLYPLTGKSGS
jgi:hypothetical protein